MASTLPTGLDLPKVTWAAPMFPGCSSISALTFMATFGGTVWTPDLAITFIPARHFQKVMFPSLCPRCFPIWHVTKLHYQGHSLRTSSSTCLQAIAHLSAHSLTALRCSVPPPPIVQPLSPFPHLSVPFPCSFFPCTLPNEGQMDKSWQEPQADAMSTSLCRNRRARAASWITPSQMLKGRANISVSCLGNRLIEEV